MKILPSPDGNQPSSNPEISIDDPDELSNCIYWAKDLKEGGKMRLANWDQKINKQQRSVQDEKSTLLAAFINPKSNADAWGDLFVPTYFTMAIKSLMAELVLGMLKDETAHALSPAKAAAGDVAAELLNRLPPLFVGLAALTNALAEPQYSRSTLQRSEKRRVGEE